MLDPGELAELVAYIVRSSRLSAEEGRRLVEDVLAFLHEMPEEYVRRRHRALQGEGLSNREIFRLLATDLAVRRFRAPPYTERQIRRMIYG